MRCESLEPSFLEKCLPLRASLELLQTLFGATFPLWAKGFLFRQPRLELAPHLKKTEKDSIPQTFFTLKKCLHHKLLEGTHPGVQ